MSGLIWIRIVFQSKVNSPSNKPDPEVIKLFFMLNSTEHEISLHIKTKMLNNKSLLLFFSQILSGVIMLINVKIPTNVGILTVFTC